METKPKRKRTKEEKRKVKLMELAGRAVIKEDKKLLQELARH
jgi:hypothetical protein